MRIRIAEERDLEGIVDIFNQGIRGGNANAFISEVTPQERKTWFQSHKNQYFILVYEENQKVIGWTSVSPYRAERLALSKTAEISYYIDLAHQNKGIGSKLVKEAIDLSIKRGIRNLFAIMLDTNEVSKKLLLNLGFSIWGHLPNIVELPNKTCGQYYIGKNLI